MSTRDGTSNKVKWKSDQSKFVPNSSPVGKGGGGGVVVTKGNFHMSMPPGFRGRTRMEDPMRSGDYEASSKTLASMLVDTTKGGVGDGGDSELGARSPLPKAAPIMGGGVKKSGNPNVAMDKARGGGKFWGDMDAKAPSASGGGGGGGGGGMEYVDIVRS